MLLFREELTADKVFVFSSYFNILAHTMSGMFVRGFAEIAECMVAVKRLQFFLTYDEFATGNTATSSRFAASTDTMNSIDSEPSSRKESKLEMPYIDDDGNGVDDDVEAAKKKPNGLASVANDIIKNTANFYNGTFFTLINFYTFNIQFR